MENYQFIQQIGHGYYGEIWLVKCSKTRKKHVLKCIDLHQAPKREQRAAYLEAKLLSTIKHPNIVPYLDSFYNGYGCLFIVMSYCEFGDLCTYIKNQNGIYFEEKQIVHWLVQICLALKYLHDRNILHRNLKTRNIFMTKNKEIKVGDLGVSKMASMSHEIIKTFIEASSYISPEIIDGGPFSEKSDIWALGCCIYEISALKHPFIAPSIPSLNKRIMKRKLQPIPRIYSSELFDIISSMLSQDLEKRPCATSLLLNDYIRRYILLNLQDSKSPDSQLSENSSTMSAEQSISDLYLYVPKKRLQDNEKSLHSSFLPMNVHKGSKCSGATARRKGDSSKAVIISVPDVNGNGDGNDNSQHRRAVDKDASLNSKFRHLNDENLNKDSVKFKNSTKTATKHRISDSGNFSSDKLKNTAISHQDQKMKSEISFQILNNLSHLLQTTRKEHLSDDSSLISSSHSGFEPNNISTRHPIISESLFAEKHFGLNMKEIMRKGNTHKVIQNVSQSNMGSLPLIKNKIQNKEECKFAETYNHLPCVKSRASSSNSSECYHNGNFQKTKLGVSWQ